MSQSRTCKIKIMIFNLSSFHVCLIKDFSFLDFYNSCSFVCFPSIDIRHPPLLRGNSIPNNTQFEKGKDWLITITKNLIHSASEMIHSPVVDPWRGKDDTIIPGFIIARPRWCIQDLPVCRILNKNSSACWLDLYKRFLIMEECTTKS